MDMQPVASSNIAAIGFEKDKMRVQFNNGGLYEASASQSDFDQFMAAKSKGQHFNKILKRAFTWTKIEKKG
jgi:hypothetical protein